MIYFRYFGYSKINPYTSDSRRIWIWSNFVDEQIDDYGYIKIKQYICWGSPNKPIIRRYWCDNFSRELYTLIYTKQNSGKYIGLLDKDIHIQFPNVISEINQYVLIEKIKNE